jgi:hypothetical protein
MVCLFVKKVADLSKKRNVAKMALLQQARDSKKENPITKNILKRKRFQKSDSLTLQNNKPRKFCFLRK